MRVFNNKEEFLGIAHYQYATIAVRILSFDDRSIDGGFWKKAIESNITEKETWLSGGK